MTRGQQRGVCLAFLFAVGGVAEYFGYEGWRVNSVPAHYLGYAFTAFAVLGLLGVNIWRGGPLDRRFEPPAPEIEADGAVFSPGDDANPYAPPRASGPGLRSIRIVSVPPGEAPEHVRRSWVGLVLPLAQGRAGRQIVAGVGVLSGPKSFAGSVLHALAGKLEQKVGYVVDASTAVAILAERSPEAARWWRENAPHAVRRGRKFLFAAQACREES
jgi:hypothetical protein